MDRSGSGISGRWTGQRIQPLQLCSRNYCLYIKGTSTIACFRLSDRSRMYVTEEDFVDNPFSLSVCLSTLCFRLVVSDFEWCPYVEDVIATVSPSTKNNDGGIQGNTRVPLDGCSRQWSTTLGLRNNVLIWVPVMIFLVWRPRNLHDSDDIGEP